MREYTVVFNEGFARGLRPNPRNPRNEEYLIEVRGAIPYDNVLSSLEDLPAPIAVVGEVWPFPQLFRNRIITLVCGRNSIYEYKSGILTLLLGDIASGSTWSCADFGEYIVLTNGKALIERDPVSGEFREYVDCKIPPCLCVCELNSQLLVGGIGGL